MGTIRINNRTYSGSSIQVVNNTVYIDGKLQDTGDEKQITISVEGDINTLTVDSCMKIDVKGDCGIVKTVSGDISCGNVTGSVSTVSGDVMTEDIGGSVQTVSGDIKCRSHK